MRYYISTVKKKNRKTLQIQTTEISARQEPTQKLRKDIVKSDYLKDGKDSHRNEEIISSTGKYVSHVQRLKINEYVKGFKL